MSKHHCPPPEDDPWFQKPGVKTCDLVADWSTDPNLFRGIVGAWAHEKGSTTPATVIDIDDEWEVDVHINTTGLLPQFWCGWWCISLCIECLCSDNDYRFPERYDEDEDDEDEDEDDEDEDDECCCYKVKAHPCYCTADKTITIPANKLRESECGDPCEVVVVVTFLTKCKIEREGGEGGEGGEHHRRSYRPGGIACAVKLPLMTFYKGV